MNDDSSHYDDKLDLTILQEHIIGNSQSPCVSHTMRRTHRRLREKLVFIKRKYVCEAVEKPLTTGDQYNYPP